MISKYIYIFIITGAFCLHCEKEFSNPVTYEAFVYPAQPTELRAFVGDRQILLTWNTNSQDSIHKYFIYRTDSTNMSFVKIDSTTGNMFYDFNVSNTMIYGYYITAVNSKAFEGPVSKTVYATPCFYSIIINDGNECTDSRSVTLSFIGSECADYIMLSNDSLFINAVWEPYTSPKTWMLDDSAGLKTVYVRFRDGQDHITFHNIFDTIMLTHNTKRPLPVALNIQSGKNESSLALYWDQSNDPEFSSYRLYRSLSPDVSNESLPIFVSRLRDENYYHDEGLTRGTVFYYKVYVYNQFGLFSESNIVYLRTPYNTVPQPVILAEPAAVVSQTLKLSWSKNRDPDFDSYRIFRSKFSLIDSSSAPIMIINNQETTTYSDVGLETNTRYYYQIYVFDTDGLASGSNIVNGRTLN